MHLPPQAEPVEHRFQSAPTADREDAAVTPQADCYCHPGNNTYWCVVGRDLWPTGLPCVPATSTSSSR